MSPPRSRRRVVGFGSRQFLQPRFAQPLQSLGNPFQLLFQLRQHLAAHFAARAFVRIVRIALLLPRRQVSRGIPRPRLAQGLLGVQAIPRGVGRLRVESMATCPSLPSPLARASSTTRVNKSFNPLACRRRNSFSVQ